MRKKNVLAVTVICFGLAGVSCNDRAQMGQGDQRNRGNGGVIPDSFSNTLTPDQFRSRSLNLKGTALTLNATVEAALAGNELAENISDDFTTACKSLALLTGGTGSADAIRSLSRQTALNLTSGDTNCKDIPAITGIDSFRTMNSLRFLATELASNQHLVTDCLAMREKRSGRQAALAWSLEPVLGQGTWLDGKTLSYFEGGAEGGGNDHQNAFSSWLNIESVAGSADAPSTNRIMSSVAAFNDVKTSKTMIEKVEQYEQASAGNVQNQIRMTKIELNYAKGEIKETTTYQNLAQGTLVSEWIIAATIAGSEKNLVLDLSSPGTAASVQYSLDSENNVGCSISN